MDNRQSTLSLSSSPTLNFEANVREEVSPSNPSSREDPRGKKRPHFSREFTFRVRERSASLRRFLEVPRKLCRGFQQA